MRKGNVGRWKKKAEYALKSGQVDVAIVQKEHARAHRTPGVSLAFLESWLGQLCA